MRGPWRDACQGASVMVGAEPLRPKAEPLFCFLLSAHLAGVGRVRIVIVGGAQDAIAQDSVAGKRQDDPLTDAPALEMAEDPASAAIQRRLLHHTAVKTLRPAHGIGGK